MATTNRVPRGLPTGPTAEQATAFTAAEMSNQAGVLQRTRRGGIPLAQDSNNFPASQYPWSVPEDSAMQLKKTVVAGGENFTGYPVPVRYNLTEEDFRYYASKKEAEEFANYERWVQQQFDFTKPSEVDRFAKMFPEYFERRLNVLKNVSDANLRYAQIMLTGAQSADDYLYLWMVQTGRIPLIQGPLWKPDSWFGAAGAAEARLALFNPFKWWNYATMPVPNVPTDGGNYFNPGLPQPVGGVVNLQRGAQITTGAPLGPGFTGIPQTAFTFTGANPYL